MAPKGAIVFSEKLLRTNTALALFIFFKESNRCTAKHFHVQIMKWVERTSNLHLFQDFAKSHTNSSRKRGLLPIFFKASR